jgi:hypothetical protein
LDQRPFTVTPVAINYPQGDAAHTGQELGNRERHYRRRIMTTTGL